MKKYLKPVLALVLVAALAVCGTIAYLTDTTEEIKNKFTVKEVDIDLTETENSYELIPDEEFAKDPTIKIVKDESYVFTDVVETIPTVALEGGQGETAYTYEFKNYVDYKINTTCGEVYLWDAKTNKLADTATAWKWTLVPASGDVTTTDGKQSTKFVYALTDTNGNLLTVSSRDRMDDGEGNMVEALYPILEGNKVAVPKALTQKMIDLLPEGTQSVDLAFTGHAVQAAGLDVTAHDAIYDAATGKTV